MTGVPVSAAAQHPAAKSGAKPRFDPRYIAPMMITVVLLVAEFSTGVLEAWWLTGVAIGAAIAVELVAGRMLTGKWPHLASAYVTGISVGILTRSGYWWAFAFCSAISILSKYVIRVKGRHIWNPSNFGICVMLVVAHQVYSTLTIQFGNSHWPMIVIWILGSIIIYRLKRFHICAAYVLSFFAFSFLRTYFTGHSFWAEVAPITGPMYQLFTFFMITDPKTTVNGRGPQILVAVLIAAVECIYRLMGNIHAPYFALFTVGPIANLVDIWWSSRRTPEPVPAAAPVPV